MREHDVATLAVDARCAHGEGIVWDAARERLIWTDIHGSETWTHDPATGGSRRWTVPDRVGVLAPCDSGQVLLGLAKGLYLADLDHGDASVSVQKLVDVELDQPTTRLNDGATDRNGNLVFGTMNEAAGHAPIGSIYQYSSARGLRRVNLQRVGIPNSICFSLDGQTMWFCDSLERKIRCCEYDAESAGVRNVRVFAELSHDQGLPDGSTIDADGCLWNAEWAGAVVRRYSPDGVVDRVVPIPTKNPTCVAFGDADLRTLYVTSSRQDHTDEELQRTPDAGGVFRIRIGDIGGLVDTPFRVRLTS